MSTSRTAPIMLAAILLGLVPLETKGAKAEDIVGPSPRRCVNREVQVVGRYNCGPPRRDRPPLCHNGPHTEIRCVPVVSSIGRVKVPPDRPTGTTLNKNYPHRIVPRQRP